MSRREPIGEGSHSSRRAVAKPVACEFRWGQGMSAAKYARFNSAVQSNPKTKKLIRVLGPRGWYIGGSGR